MRISVPAGVAIVLAAVFSAYHLVLAATSLPLVSNVIPVVVSMVLYAVATAIVLLSRSAVLPVWAAASAVAVAVIVPTITAPVVVRSDAATGYATWWIAAVGTIGVILIVRHRPVFGWIGVGFLVVHTFVWDGLPGIVGLGVVGSVCWAGVATASTFVIVRADRTAREFLRAEQTTIEWLAEQDAHVHERQFRLSQTRTIARPMLQRIVETEGSLSDDERVECMRLEQAIRDEIRGRALLSDGVRAEVRRLREAGAVVNLHDDGGIDGLGSDVLEHVHAEIVTALRHAEGADSVIVRTTTDDDALVTVVGLRGSAATSEAATLGTNDEADEDECDDPVVVWAQIPRVPRKTADEPEDR